MPSQVSNLVGCAKDSLFIGRVVLCTNLILLMLTCTNCPTTNATTWFVRPLEGEYGCESGINYGIAFDGFKGINWGRGGVEDGDTVYLCGTHRESLQVKRSNLTIRFDCKENPGVIYGSKRVFGNEAGWRGPNQYGEFSLYFPNECNVVARNGKILLRGLVGKLKENQWGWSNGRFYLGAAPHEHVFEIGVRKHAITWDENESIRNLTVIGNGLGDTKILLTNEYAIGPKDQYPEQYANNTYTYPNKINFGTLKVRGLYFFGVQAVQTYFWYNMDANIIDDCDILESPSEGLYLGAGRANIIVRNCRIGSKNHDNFGWGSAGTAHAGDGIDIKGGKSYNVRKAHVHDNKIINVRGCGIVSSCNNLLIEDNYIRDCGWKGTHFDKKNRVDFAGIVVGGGEKASELSDTIVVRNNTIIQDGYLENGIMVRGAQKSSIIVELLENTVIINGTSRNTACYVQPVVNQRYRRIIGNTFVGGTYGIKTNYGDPINCLAMYNTVVDNAVPLSLASSGEKGVGFIIRDNVFHAFYENRERYPYRIGDNFYETIVAMDKAEPNCFRNKERESNSVGEDIKIDRFK